jgi:hypothetical protein
MPEATPARRATEGNAPERKFLKLYPLIKAPKYKNLNRIFPDGGHTFIPFSHDLKLFEFF